MAIRVKATILKDGNIITEVLDRAEGTLCSTVYKVTNSLGKQLNDEHIGPEGDTVNEIQS